MQPIESLLARCYLLNSLKLLCATIVLASQQSRDSPRLRGGTLGLAIPPAEGRLVCWQAWTVVNKAVVNVCVQIFLRM